MKIAFLPLFLASLTASMAAPGGGGFIPKSLNASESADLIVPDSLPPDGRHAVAIPRETSADASSTHNFLDAINDRMSADFEGVYRVADGSWENRKLKSGYETR